MKMKLRTLPKRTAAPALMLLMLAAVLLAVSPAVLCAQSVNFAGATTVIPLPGLSGAQGIVVDRAGNIFATFNSRVVEITPAGVQTTVPFTGLNGVSGLALDTAGDLFAADTANSRVLKLTPAGVQTTVYTTPDGVFPSGMTMDGAGDLFILYGSGSMATDSSAVVKIAPGSGGPGTGPVTVQPAELVFPAAILVDGAGNFYITDQGPLTVLKLTPEGVQTTVATGFKRPTGLAMDAVGNIYVGDSEGHQLVKLPADGSPQIQVPISIPTSPEALAMTADGNLVIGDDVPSRLLEVYLVSPNFNSVNICQAGQTAPSPCSATLTLTYYVNADGDLGTAKVLTQGAPNLDFTLAAGGTCTGAVTAGSTCTVNVTFAPQLAGVRAGAVQLTDTSGNLLVTTAVYGVGLGSQIAYGPGTQIPLSLSGVGSIPHAVAVDAAGNVFIADSSNDRVVKIPVGGGPQTTVGTGLNEPFGVAVDGAGNVFIADNQNARVVEVPSGGGAQITVPVSGLLDPIGLALDGAGDLFISDADNENVVKVPAGGGPQTIVASDGFVLVAGIAVDGVGNLFIADGINNRIVEAPAGGAPLITLPFTGLSEPLGVAVDAAGDLFVTDFHNNRVEELPAGGGTQITVAIGVSLPEGLAVSGAGDVFVVGNALVEIQHSQPPSLSFATTAGGSTSTDSPQSVTIQSIGNQPLNAIAPGLSIGPSFVQVAGSGTPADCTSSFSLIPGATCNMSISFTPVAGGLIQSAAVLTDNALNGNPATQSITLSGTGEGVTPTLSFGPIANQAYGAAPLAVSATSNSTGAITYSVVSGPATISGNIVTLIGAGSVTLQASQVAAGNYAAATAQTSFTVNKEPQSITFQSIASQMLGTSVTVGASSSSGLAVSFTSLTTSVCTVSSTQVTLLNTGTCTIQASQAGTANYAAATPVTQSFTVLPGAGFTITPIPTKETIKRGVLGAFILQLNSVKGFNGNVTLNCSGGPAGAKCADFPQTVKVNGVALALSGILFPANTTPGTYTITFTGTSGTLTNTATAEFTVLK
jgi:sugar lactone lactonase YvrE